MYIDNLQLLSVNVQLRSLKCSHNKKFRYLPIKHYSYEQNIMIYHLKSQKECLTDHPFLLCYRKQRSIALILKHLIIPSTININKYKYY